MTIRLMLIAAVLLVGSYPVSPANAAPAGSSRQQTGIKDQAQAPSQQEDGWVAIKTDDGILFVWNVRGLYFTLSVKGKEIKPLEDPEHIFFSVDGLIFQIQLAAIRDFAPDAKQTKLSDRAILAAHRDWEAKFIEELLKSPLKVKNLDAKLSSGSDASLWQYDMPEGKDTEAKQQVYLTIVSKDYVLLLNGVATATLSDEMVRKFLLDTIATLKISPTRIDVKTLSESIRKGEAP